MIGTLIALALHGHNATMAYGTVSLMAQVAKDPSVYALVKNAVATTKQISGAAMKLLAAVAQSNAAPVAKEPQPAKASATVADPFDNTDQLPATKKAEKTAEEIDDLLQK